MLDTSEIEMNQLMPHLFVAPDENVCAKNYNEAIGKLNGLQKTTKKCQMSEKITKMWRYLSRAGIFPQDMKKLSVIHITGTKGKGSTGAFCESILRSHGFKTGFYSSPHLILVNERIRLLGKPIDKIEFVNYFNCVYSDLYKTQEFEKDMPGYFCFLTIMAFKVFIDEYVDVGVIEVGIGGLHDFTNVVNNVIAVGITALGLDHTTVLGNTIESIAFQKAGIIKPGCKAFTVEQREPALQVLQDVADNNKCILHKVPKLGSYTTSSGEPLNLKTCGLIAYELNISLALQLARCWMEKNNTDNISMLTELSDKTVNGLKSCIWLGRFQKLQHLCGDFYLDGAHTNESIEMCADWFSRNLREDTLKILVFNIVKNRNLRNLIEPLLEIDYDLIVFMPNVSYEDPAKCLDAAYGVGQLEKQLEKCGEYILETKNLLTVKKPDTVNKVKLAETRSAEGTLKLISEFSKNRGIYPQILVTGSLHLVGDMLRVLDPAIGD